MPGSFDKFNALFKGKSQGSIGGSDELRAQAQSFAKMCDMWIENLDRLDICEIQSRRFAVLHKARGVSSGDIQVFIIIDPDKEIL